MNLQAVYDLEGGGQKHGQERGSAFSEQLGAALRESMVRESTAAAQYNVTREETLRSALLGLDKVVKGAGQGG